jgi:hypothetical protein
MKLRNTLVALGIGLLVTSAPLHAENMNLTIYSKATPGAVNPSFYRPLPGQSYGGWFGESVPGYAVVRDRRELELKDKRSKVQFSDVAALIDPTTVTFTSITDPKGTKVLEQNYLFDLVSTQKLTERFLGQKITVEQALGDKIETTTGTLLSAGGGMVLKGDDGKITSVNGYQNLKFPALPDGLMTEPTLMWDVLTDQPGKHQVDVSYETAGITWWTDYNLIFTPDASDANQGSVDLSAWVSILNQSGASYNDAKLKLVAGDVQRAQPNNMRQNAYERAPKAMAMAEDAAGFAEKAFFEYHLYTLGRSTTLPDRSTKQIELFPAVSHVPVEKNLVFEGSSIPYYGGTYTDRNYGNDSTTKKADVYLSFKNDKEHGMGMPLPAGRLRVSQKDDADGSLEFIGEDVVEHTPKDEKILVRLGSAFDVVGERKQVDFRSDDSRRWMQETIEVKLRNHKDKDVKVLVRENLYRSVNWRITDSTQSYEKKNAHTVEFPLTVAADKEKTIRYTVEYTW